MFLDSINKSLEVVLGSVAITNAMHIAVDYVDLTTTATQAGSSDTQSNGIAVVTILAAPAADTSRKVNGLTIHNADTAAASVTVRLNSNSTLRPIIIATLQAGDTLGYTDTRGWYVQDSQGQLKTSAVTLSSTAPLMDGIDAVGTSQTASRSDHIHPTDTSLIPLTQKASANGVASLDAGAKIPVSQMPVAVVGAMNYQGAWNAAANTPALVSSVGTKGFYYVVSVPGSTNLNGNTAWSVNDTVVFNGTTWDIIQGSVTSGEIATALGYIAESNSNKSDDVALTANSASLYPTQHAAKAYINAAQAAAIATASTDATSKAIAAQASARLDSQLGVFDASTKTLIPTAQVACFLYDTSKDSDGGAWRKRCSSMSWENEALCSGKYLGNYASATAATTAGGAVGDYFYNTVSLVFNKLTAPNVGVTVYRGNRRDFPEQVIITAGAGRVILWDATQVDCPMWMVFNGGYQQMVFTNGSTYPISCVTALNGKIAIGTGGTGFGVTVVDFLRDNAKVEHSSVTTNTGTTLSNIAARNLVTTQLADNTPIVNAIVYSVAMAVLPSAPIDVATGLPIPTLFIGTAGGISTIKDNGTVANCFQATWTYNTIFNLALSRDGMTLMAQGVSGNGLINNNYSHFDIPLSAALAGLTTLETYAASNGYRWDAGAATSLSETRNRVLVVGRSSGLVLVQGARAGAIAPVNYGVTKPDAMQCFISSTFNSGWMNGTIKGAWLSDIVTGAVGATVADRSPGHIPLTLVGALTTSAVAAGAQLVSYSGFNSANYLEQAYSANLDFGTGDFSFVWWESGSSAQTQRFMRDTVGGGATNAIGIRVAGASLYYVYLGTAYINTGVTPAAGTDWRQVVLQRVSGVAQLYINGALKWSAPNTTNLTNATAILRVGTDTGTTPMWIGTPQTLLRASASAFSQEQLTFVYETERKLFVDGAQCYIQGGAGTVSALAYDEATDLLHVGTGWGRTAFKGLVVQSSKATTIGVPAAYSAADGNLVEVGSASSNIYAPAKYIRDELGRAAEQARAYGKELVTQSFIAVASQTIFTLPVGFIPKSCYQNGLLRKLASGAGFWSFTFDGFRYSVVLGTGAAVSDDISILCIRN